MPPRPGLGFQEGGGGVGLIFLLAFAALSRLHERTLPVTSRSTYGLPILGADAVPLREQAQHHTRPAFWACRPRFTADLIPREAGLSSTLLLDAARIYGDVRMGRRPRRRS